MIVEGLMTTRDAAGRLNLAAMGGLTDPEFRELAFRPFRSSQTFQNLQATGCGVFHLTDDVGLIARAALAAEPTAGVAFREARCVAGSVIEGCSRWWEFEVANWELDELRGLARAKIVATGEGPPGRGFHRAKHAVLEATILATRTHLISEAEVRAELKRWEPLVSKTAGPAEWAAWEFVCAEINRRYQANSSAG